MPDIKINLFIIRKLKMQKKRKRLSKYLIITPAIILLVAVFPGSTRAQHNSTPKEVAYNAAGLPVKLLHEYQYIIEKYRVDGKLSPGQLKAQISASEKNRLLTLYLSMSKEQQMQQTVGFIYPPAPMTEKVPTIADINNWKDGAKYGIWINEKRVHNKTLGLYKNTDFAYVYVSRLSNRAMHYGKYSYQVDLMTRTQYEQYKAHAATKMNDYILIFKKRTADRKI